MTHHPSRSGKQHRESRMRVKCPHCRSYARARSSDLLTPLYREIRFECINDACGHIWVAGLEAIRTLCPSDIPNPEIQIPLSEAYSAPSPQVAAPATAAG